MHLELWHLHNITMFLLKTISVHQTKYQIVVHKKTIYDRKYALSLTYTTIFKYSFMPRMFEFFLSPFPYHSSNLQIKIWIAEHLYLLTRSIRDSETSIDFVQGPPGSSRERVNFSIPYHLDMYPFHHLTQLKYICYNSKVLG